VSLRRIATALGKQVGEIIHPVSLLHADKVPAESLHGRPAVTFEPFLRARAEEGERSFFVLPLFFGPSRALTEFIPEKVVNLNADIGGIKLQLGSVLCPLPAGEPLLTSILWDNIRSCASNHQVSPRRIVLVDHGSPTPEITAVRRRLGAELRRQGGNRIRLAEAVMERRPGPEYDFNGELLEGALRRMAAEDPKDPVILSMLFLLAGRHAGPGGDVEKIFRRVEADHPGFRVYQSPLVGDHPGLLDILQARLDPRNPI
jgi:sirohydrochlorin ferrochelatase